MQIQRLQSNRKRAGWVHPKGGMLAVSGRTASWLPPCVRTLRWLHVARGLLCPVLLDGRGLRGGPLHSLQSPQSRAFSGHGSQHLAPRCDLRDLLVGPREHEPVASRHRQDGGEEPPLADSLHHQARFRAVEGHRRPRQPTQLRWQLLALCRLTGQRRPGDRLPSPSPRSLASSGPTASRSVASGRPVSGRTVSAVSTATASQLGGIYQRSALRNRNDAWRTSGPASARTRVPR